MPENETRRYDLTGLWPDDRLDRDAETRLAREKTFTVDWDELQSRPHAELPARNEHPSTAARPAQSHAPSGTDRRWTIGALHIVLLTVLAFVVIAALKIAGVVAWSWWWVFSIMLFPTAFFAVVLFVYLVVDSVSRKKRSPK